MSDGSTIEWLQRPGTKPATWNPIRAVRHMPDGTVRRGWHCEHVTSACVFCYAERLNEGRFGTGLPFKPGHKSDVEIYLDEKTLLQPLKWRQPRTIFVCSMSDLYGPWVKDEWLDAIKAVQTMTPHHTYIELTKRPEGQRDYLRVLYGNLGMTFDRLTDVAVQLTDSPCAAHQIEDADLPLKNVWAGPSVADQDDADKFVPIVLDTPLAVRIVSAEPLLGPIDFTRIRIDHPSYSGVPASLDALVGRIYDSSETPIKDTARLDQIILGGESGPNARDCDIANIRSILTQCRAAGTAAFVKQLGARPIDSCRIDDMPVQPENADPAALAVFADHFVRFHLRDKKGGDINEFPDDLKVREWPR